MRARNTTKTLLLAGAAVSLVCVSAIAARAGEVKAADPFATVQTVEQGDLDGLRGGDSNVLDSYNTNVEATATNTSTNSIGTFSIDSSGGTTGGAVYGGNVSFGGTALDHFDGVFTSAINTAPGGIATALTSMTITLNP